MIAVIADGRHLLLTQIDSEEWESLGSVDMHTVPNAKAGPFSPRTADVAAAASAAADVRNRVRLLRHHGPILDQFVHDFSAFLRISQLCVPRAPCACSTWCHAYRC